MANPLRSIFKSAKVEPKAPVKAAKVKAPKPEKVKKALKVEEPADSPTPEVAAPEAPAPEAPKAVDTPAPKEAKLRKPKVKKEKLSSRATSNLELISGVLADYHKLPSSHKASLSTSITDASILLSQVLRRPEISIIGSVLPTVVQDAMSLLRKVAAPSPKTDSKRR